MPRDTLLVLDECLPKTLAGTLGHRGRSATSVRQLGLVGVKDPELLPRLAAIFADQSWVLVTGDDAMPAEHGPLIIETKVTVATIHPEHPEGVTEHAWNMDIVHRWAHSMQDQEQRTVRRYHARTSQPWTPRRRHVRKIGRDNLEPWRPEDAKQAVAAETGAAVPVKQQRLPGM